MQNVIVKLMDARVYGWMAMSVCQSHILGIAGKRS